MFLVACVCIIMRRAPDVCGLRWVWSNTLGVRGQRLDIRVQRAQGLVAHGLVVLQEEKRRQEKRRNEKWKKVEQKS